MVTLALASYLLPYSRHGILPGGTSFALSLIRTNRPSVTRILYRRDEHGGETRGGTEVEGWKTLEETLRWMWRGQEERRGREERSVVDTSLQQPSLHLPFTGNPIFALLLWPFLSSRAKVLSYIYIYIRSSTTLFLSSRLFTTLVPLRSFAILVPAIRLAKQPRISRYSASGDGEGKGGGKFLLRRRGETVDRGEVCVGVERCGLEGFRKGGEDFIYLFFFFQRES